MKVLVPVKRVLDDNVKARVKPDGGAGCGANRAAVDAGLFAAVPELGGLL